MRSVRLDTALEAQLEEAARLSGEPVSQIIRRAIKSQYRKILGERLAPRLKESGWSRVLAVGPLEREKRLPSAGEKQGAAMILVDAGPLVALLDRGEQDHERWRERSATDDGAHVTTWPAYTEAMYLLGAAGGWVAQEVVATDRARRCSDSGIR